MAIIADNDWSRSFNIEGLSSGERRDADNNEEQLASLALRGNGMEGKKDELLSAIYIRLIRNKLATAVLSHFNFALAVRAFLFVTRTRRVNLQ
jgi:hypothetical protein